MVVCMTASHKQALAPYVAAEKLFEAKDLIGEEVDDPYGRDIDAYRACAAKLGKLADALVKKISDNGKGTAKP